MNAPLFFDYEHIFLKAPIGMCVTQSRVISDANEAVAKMFAYARRDLIGESLLVLYPTPEEFERTGERIAPIMNIKGHYSDERIMKRANNELFWVHVVGWSLVPNDPHAAGIWTFEDLSAKRPVTAELTPREREIAALVVEGKTSKLIARQIGLSPRTVEMHRANLMRKFSATTSGELVHRLVGVTH
ncbi:MAG: PAS domain-containing protein [Burkholderiales bacterium]|nr:PAS domain-containing protein [Burkholderiales bacterium]